MVEDAKKGTAAAPAGAATKDDPRVDIARQNLRMACALRGLNFSEVSRRAGMARNGLSQFLQGRTTLTYGNLLRICDVLEVPVGLVHRPDAITEGRIRIAKALERMPEHKLVEAMQLIEQRSQ